MGELNKNYAWLVTLRLMVFKNNPKVFLSLHFVYCDLPLQVATSRIEK